MIPVFLPYMGCKHRCVFCDQLALTETPRPIPPEDLGELIETYLRTRDEYDLAFYGGTFTGMDEDLQFRYIEAARRWIGRGIRWMRISTRPDEIDEEIADFLYENGVRIVEVGAQSMFDEVLEASKRGHDSGDVLRAIDILRSRGFVVGVHLMVGLPKSDEWRDLSSASILSKSGVDMARIHPTLVFRGTELESMMEMGDYEPLSLDEAISRSARMTAIFEGMGVRVIRIGLYVPPSALDRIVAGPHHPAIGALVRQRILLEVCSHFGVKNIEYDSKHESWIFGFGGRKAFENLGLNMTRGTSLRLDGIEFQEVLRRYAEWLESSISDRTRS